MLSSAHPVSVLGKVYLVVSLVLFVLAGIWAAVTLQANAAWVEVLLVVPRFDFIEPVEQRRYEANLAVILAGWAVALGLLALAAIRAPFRIRGTAIEQRRIRELEREVLELRTLPLRQHEEDEILAAEAHIEPHAKKVMTEKIRLDTRARPGGVRP